MKVKILWAIITLCTYNLSFAEKTMNNNPKWTEQVQTVLDVTKPLVYNRGNRLPLFTNPTSDPGQLDDKSAGYLVYELNKRGIGIICSWSPGKREESLSQAMVIARAQQKLGLSVNINATSCMYSFFNGDERTAHIDENGNAFFDTTLWSQKMGCPFAIDFRKQDIREQIEYFARAYENEGIDIGFIWADWEIDGPLEVNGAHETSKKCVRCRNNIKNIDDFSVFQKKIREMRSYLQYYVYSEPILSRFPNALVGNYAVYPHNGYRYWLDYFEADEYVDGQPYIKDHRAKYRTWYNDYPSTGYTYAMPTVYTWYRIFNWYDFDNPDYRWFYNMLLVASNAGKSTPANIPIITFVRWHTTDAPEKPDPNVKQFGSEAYQELLWHMLLRGTDTFFVWCGGEETSEEVRLVHEVYAEAQQYGEFLGKGMPVNFDVPEYPGTVISGLVLRDRVLIRRTDFGTSHKPVEIIIGVQKISVEYAPGICRIIELP